MDFIELRQQMNDQLLRAWDKSMQHEIDYPEQAQHIKNLQKQITEQKNRIEELKFTIIAMIILMFIAFFAQIIQSL